MGVSIEFNGKKFLSSLEAAKRFGYTSDYISRLARQGKIAGTRVGTQWFVAPESLVTFSQAAEKNRKERSENLRKERAHERVNKKIAASQKSPQPPGNVSAHVDVADTASLVKRSAWKAHADAVLVVLAGLLVAYVATSMSFSPHIGKLAYDGMHTFTHVSQEVFQRASFFEFFTLRALRSDITIRSYIPQKTGNHSVSGGIVVLPESADADTLKFVRDSFSDEVEVKLSDDKTSGIITPIFEDGTGDPYRFVVVPVEQKKQGIP